MAAIPLVVRPDSLVLAAAINGLARAVLFVAAVLAAGFVAAVYG